LGGELDEPVNGKRPDDGTPEGECSEGHEQGVLFSTREGWRRATRSAGSWKSWPRRAELEEQLRRRDGQGATFTAEPEGVDS
jgi:hypothetical protein